MTTTYKTYLDLNLDGGPVGFGRGESESCYFCTPKGAHVIGWAGVDGVHYCFVPGFGEMVFAVSPMNTPGDYVHPVARDFKDFLRLLLACGDAAPLDQAYAWDQGHFDTFLQENPTTAAQEAVLEVIREALSLTPMEQPFAYLKALQEGFDSRALTYSEAPAAPPPPEPEWKVYFEGNFWGGRGRRADTELPIRKQFVWGDEVWSIPAVYSCSKGLVADFCMRVSPAAIRAFLDRWDRAIDSDGHHLDDDQRMQLEAENPLSANIRSTVLLNGRVLPFSHGCGVWWNPCSDDGNDQTAEQVLRHYGLDPAYGWTVQRACFPWATKRRPQMKTLSVTLMQQPAAIPGPRFRVSAPGDSIAFTHPATGAAHTLTVQEYERQELDTGYFGNENMAAPTHCTAMGYTLTPDLPHGECSVVDCRPSDQPRLAYTDPNESASTSLGATAIGIIGGSDGPTAILCGECQQGALHAVCSALCFEPADDVEWRMVFHVKQREDHTEKLL